MNGKPKRGRSRSRWRFACVLGIASVCGLELLVAVGMTSNLTSDLTSIAERRELAQRAAIAGAFAGARELPDERRAQGAAAAVSTFSLEEASATTPQPLARIEIGRWNPSAQTFEARDGEIDAVRVTLRHGGDPSLVLRGLHLVGLGDPDFEATAIVFVQDRADCRGEPHVSGKSTATTGATEQQHQGEQQDHASSCTAARQASAKLVRPAQMAVPPLAWSPVFP